MLIVNTLLGASLLIWGRKLFWLFIAAAGFLTGWQIAQAITQNQWVGIIVGIFFAIGGALLAVFLKTLAIGVAGFLMGGWVLSGLAGLIGIDSGILFWIIYLIGGIGGALIIGTFFDWTVIILSSLGGAALITDVLPITGMVRVLTLIGLVILGVVIQASQLRGDKKD
jgi:hypothetical protein